MADDKITRFPISGSKRRKNKLGPRVVECITTGRLLLFDDVATPVGDIGNVVFLDVLPMPEDDSAALPVGRLDRSRLKWSVP